MPTLRVPYQPPAGWQRTNSPSPAGLRIVSQYETGSGTVSAQESFHGVPRRRSTDSEALKVREPPAFHALAWIHRSPERHAAIADLHEDCENFDSMVGGVVIVDGVRYVCFAVHAFDLLPPYRKGQLVELVVTDI